MSTFTSKFTINDNGSAQFHFPTASYFGTEIADYKEQKYSGDVPVRGEGQNRRRETPNTEGARKNSGRKGRNV
jgi:hypothetical protein